MQSAHGLRMGMPPVTGLDSVLDVLQEPAGLKHLQPIPTDVSSVSPQERPCQNVHERLVREPSMKKAWGNAANIW